MTVVVRAATDLGLKRTQNEDSHGSWIPGEGEERARRGVLLVICDGMGGSKAGEVASKLAVQTVLRCYREAAGEDPLEDLYRAVETANQLVHHESSTNPDLSGMGTTCTAIVVRERDAFIAHVGDSRAYLVHNGRIRQLTRDHSLVAQLVRDGQLTPDQARVDPRRNMVTRSVGVSAQVEIDADHEPGLLVPGDTLLMCTDGLHGQVVDEELKTAASSNDLDQGCRDAIALANQRGGPDNITVIMARLHEDGDMRAAGSGSRRAREDDDDDDDDDDPPVARDGTREDPPRPYALRAESRRSSSKMLMWLIVALAVLLIAVAAMALIVRRMGQETKGLGTTRSSPAREARVAWR